MKPGRYYQGLRPRIWGRQKKDTKGTGQRETKAESEEVPSKEAGHTGGEEEGTGSSGATGVEIGEEEGEGSSTKDAGMMGRSREGEDVVEGGARDGEAIPRVAPPRPPLSWR